MMVPTISVILPVFNGEKHVRAAIDSILQQTYSDIELILIDDGSNDRTNEIIHSYSDPRIRCIDHPSNQGLVASLNEGISNAQGKYLARMDADDISLPERFARQVAFLEQNPKVGVLGTQARFVDESLENCVWEYQFPTRHAEIAWKMMFMNIIAHPTVMIRRMLLDNQSAYDPEFPTAQDYELWTRLISRTEFANLSEQLILYRRHSFSVSEHKKQIQNDIALHIRQKFILSATGIDLTRDQLMLLFQSDPYDKGLSQEEYKQFVELNINIFSSYQKLNGLQPETIRYILTDINERLQSAYVKPLIVTEEVIVMREPTKEELRLLMIANMPSSWQRIYKFLRKLHLISNPLPKDYYE